MTTGNYTLPESLVAAAKTIADLQRENNALRAFAERLLRVHELRDNETAARIVADVVASEAAIEKLSPGVNTRKSMAYPLERPAPGETIAS